MASVLIIEDEEEIRRQLELLLKNAGYEPLLTDDFEDIPGQVRRLSPDLVLLDVNLPGQNGTWICRQIREKSDVPVIFVTGRDTSMDELEGMMAGGDDYVTKPYHGAILLAHIEAVLKRWGRLEKEKEETGLCCRGVDLNVVNSSISFEGRQAELTKNELRICHYLFTHQGRIVPRADLIEYLWENEIFIDDNTLSVNITRIRNKLREIGAADLIRTRRGQGYLV